MNHKASSPIAIIFIVLIVVIGLAAIYFMFFAEEYKPGECDDCKDVETYGVYEHIWKVEGKGTPIIVFDGTSPQTWTLNFEDTDFVHNEFTYSSLDELDFAIDSLPMTQDHKDLAHHIADCMERKCHG